MSFGSIKGGCLFSLRWWNGGWDIVILSYALANNKQIIFLSLLFEKSLFIFYVREPADRRKDEMMGREEGKSIDSQMPP